MKRSIKGTAILFSLLLLSCGEKKEKEKEGFSLDRQKVKTEQQETPAATNDIKASERIVVYMKWVV